MRGYEPGGESPKVALLLSTYNGGKYIAEQLESLMSQSYSNFKIYVRDDGSTDDTVQIVSEFVGDRLEIVFDSLGNLGPARSFLSLLLIVKAEIYMFCDQDDVWCMHKVEEAVNRISKFGFLTPVLFHTDLDLVDGSLFSLQQTFNERVGVEIPADYAMRRMLLQNCMVGCTVAVNDALVIASGIRRSDFRSQDVAMHDWWLGLCAVLFGFVEYSKRTSVLYRQHAANVSGVSHDRHLINRLRATSVSAGMARLAGYKLKIGKQARLLLDIHVDNMTIEEKYLLRGISRLAVGSGLRGLVFCIRQRIFFKRWYMNAGVFLVALWQTVFQNKKLDHASPAAAQRKR